ncbi:hypothetical protein MMC09_002047 [Bachmanniomyces sp. S44760]|nr:hypothetical protein [Bachmanniomyces sp. S44760]
MEQDPFDSILGLEDKFYNEGYALGVNDGVKAGHIEGRMFGLEKGFEKYVEMGKLHGKAVVWAGRLPGKRESPWPRTATDDVEVSKAAGTPEKAMELQGIHNQRIEKQIRTLYALVEPESLSTHNDETSVSDFDDRFKRAQGKARIIEKSNGDVPGLEASTSTIRRSVQRSITRAEDGGNIEDVNIHHARH